MTFYKNLGILILTVISGIAFIVTLRCMLIKPPSHVLDLAEKFKGPDGPVGIKLTDSAVQRFQKALQFQTIAYKPGEVERENLEKYGDFIAESYPAIYSSSFIKVERVNKLSLLYTITGSDPSLEPYLLMGHLDVVPTPRASEWEAPPFSGDVVGSHIYGRGTIDAKQIVMGVLEAVEHYVTNEGQPKRSFYIGFGHDEEVSGHEGAAEIASLLTSRGVHLLYIIDEGTTVAKDIVPGVEPPVAVVSTAEKGYLTLRLSVNSTGGHSSMPIGDNAIAILSAALARIHDNPLPSRIGEGPEKEMFLHLTPFTSTALSMAMKNLWLFKPVVDMIMSKKAAANAMLRTTTAVTMVQGGVKENVLPTNAWAVVNHRIHPADNVDNVLAFDTAVVNDARVKLEVLASMEPHPVSSSDAFGFHCVAHSIMEAFPSVATVVPGVMIGNTDTKHYLHLSDNVYRFSPTFNTPIDLPRFHGLNERISLQNYEQAINFYSRLLHYSDLTTLSDLQHHHQHDSL